MLASAHGTTHGGFRLLAENIFRRFHARSAALRLANLRRRGTGVYSEEWLLGPEPRDITSEIITWCRDTLAGSRRPWGLADFELAVAFGGLAGPETLRLPRTAPADLYRDDSPLVTRLHAFLERAESVAAQGPITVAAALRAWGELAHAALAD